MTTANKPEVRTHDPVTSTDLLPHGHVSDGQGGSVPRGEMILRDAMDKPLDLEKNLERFKRNRDVVLRFCAEVLQEAAYDKATGDLIPGRLNDYYMVPGSVTKALTKKGSENLAQLFQYFKAATDTVSHTETAEYCSFIMRVTLMDKYGRLVGSGTGACSTAEKGFRTLRAQAKYGAEIVYEKDKDPVIMRPADYRAALHDLQSRAGKRAFVQAVIYATATDEIFHVAAEVGGEDEPIRTAPAAASGAASFRLPFDSREYKASGGTKGFKKGTSIGQIPQKELNSIRAFCKKIGKFDDLVQAIDAVVMSQVPDVLTAEEADGLPF